ncbi:MAG: BrnT family toxin [Methylocystis sp.]
MSELEFEWDEDKAAANLAKHGVSFLRAAEVFANEMIEKVDDRKDYGELRFIALGRVEAEVYRVVYTWRGEGVVRLISAQKANKREREIYYREIFSQ